ncbi:MAG: YfiR family protein [Comamonadaceae bacterium]|nr:YfiR family protein [Comamonadaceae bacterium]
MGRARRGWRGGLPDEYQVKAAFIYNFAKFVEWPADSLGPKEAPLVVPGGPGAGVLCPSYQVNLSNT